MNTMLTDALTDRFPVSQITLTHSAQSDHHTIRGGGRQIIEPIREGSRSVVELKFAYIDHFDSTVYLTIQQETEPNLPVTGTREKLEKMDQEWVSKAQAVRAPSMAALMMPPA
jgi:hypothetical protein